jgi:hypothetical protein
MNELPSIDEAVMEGQPRYAMDRLLRVEFFAGVTPNLVKSEEAGRPIFDDADFVRINIPGDVRSSFEALADNEYKRRFQPQWQAYQKGLSQEAQGISLDKLPGMSMSVKASLAASNITTVEQLATLSDTLATGLHGIHELRRKAIALIEVNKGAEGKKYITDELSKRDAEIAELKAQMTKIALSKTAPAK